MDILVSPLGVQREGSLIGYMAQIQDITDLKQTEARLQEHQRQLRSLASQLSLAEERERRRLAQGLHDEVGQSLVAVKVKLGALGDAISTNEDRRELDEIRTLVESALQQTRSLTFDLSPPVLYELGLNPALEWLLEQFQMNYGLACVLEDDGWPKPLGDELRGLLFSAVRELLVNVVKYAHARSVNVSVRRVGDDITIGVADDGIGFDTSDTGLKNRGFGLFNLRERLSAVGGGVTLWSEPGAGTTITLAAPLTHQPVFD